MTGQRKTQAGLSLVELMVAMTLSMVLLAGVILIFSANKTTYRMQTGLSLLQENGRYAIRKIADDLQIAGFGGCLSPHLAPRVVMLASNPPAYLEDYSNGLFLAGQNDVTSTTTIGGIEVSTNGGTGTDTIEVRGPLTSNVTFVTGELLTNDTVNVTGTTTGFATDEYLLLADCAGADVFRATAVATSGGNTQISHAATKNIQATLSRRYGADSVVTEFATHTYFIGETSRDYRPGVPVTALYRFDGNNSEELVDGVEDLQVRYALDTDDDSIIDSYADPGGVTDWSQVMAVRISLLINSVSDSSSVVAPYTFDGNSFTPASDDLRLRQEFSQMVSVRNATL